MSSSKTENLNLHAWTPDDPVKMSEFNENFAILDRAARIVTGSYVGNGAYGESSPTTLTLDFAPKFLMIWQVNGANTAVSLSGFSLRITNYNTNWGCTTTWDGTTVSWYNATSADRQMNANAYYTYLAVG